MGCQCWTVRPPSQLVLTLAQDASKRSPEPKYKEDIHHISESYFPMKARSHDWNNTLTQAKSISCVYHPTAGLIPRVSVSRSAASFLQQTASLPPQSAGYFSHWEQTTRSLHLFMMQGLKQKKKKSDIHTYIHTVYIILYTIQLLSYKKPFCSLI